MGRSTGEGWGSGGPGGFQTMRPPLALGVRLAFLVRIACAVRHVTGSVEHALSCVYIYTCHMLCMMCLPKQEKCHAMQWAIQTPVPDDDDDL